MNKLSSIFELLTKLMNNGQLTQILSLFGNNQSNQQEKKENYSPPKVDNSQYFNLPNYLPNNTNKDTGGAKIKNNQQDYAKQEANYSQNNSSQNNTNPQQNNLAQILEVAKTFLPLLSKNKSPTIETVHTQSTILNLKKIK